MTPELERLQEAVARGEYDEPGNAKLRAVLSRLEEDEALTENEQQALRERQARQAVRLGYVRMGFNWGGSADTYTGLSFLLARAIALDVRVPAVITSGSSGHPELGASVSVYFISRYLMSALRDRFGRRCGGDSAGVSIRCDDGTGEQQINEIVALISHHGQRDIERPTDEDYDRWRERERELDWRPRSKASTRKESPNANA
jgi:hypothetical protein